MYLTAPRSTSTNGVSGPRFSYVEEDAETVALAEDKAAFYREYLSPMMLYQALAVRSFSLPLFLRRTLSYCRPARPKPRRGHLLAEDVLQLSNLRDRSSAPFSMKHFRKHLQVAIVYMEISQKLGDAAYRVVALLKRNGVTMSSTDELALGTHVSFTTNFFEWQAHSQRADKWTLDVQARPASLARSAPVTGVLVLEKGAMDGEHVIELRLNQLHAGSCRVVLAWTYDTLPVPASVEEATLLAARQPKKKGKDQEEEEEEEKEEEGKEAEAQEDNKEEDDEESRVVVYVYFYDRNRRYQYERFDEFTCPWCTATSASFASVTQLYTHLRACHAHFSFRLHADSRPFPIIKVCFQDKSKLFVPALCGVEAPPLTRPQVASPWYFFAALRNFSFMRKGSFLRKRGLPLLDPEEEDVLGDDAWDDKDSWELLDIMSDGRWDAIIQDAKRNGSRLRRRGDDDDDDDDVLRYRGHDGGDGGEGDDDDQDGEQRRKRHKKASTHDIPMPVYKQASRKKRSFQEVEQKWGPLVAHLSPADQRRCLKLMQYDFYHASSFVPLEPHELLHDDSDADADEEWRIAESERLVDEFEDVTYSEKQFFKLWNRFIAQQPQGGGGGADADFFVVCRKFVRATRRSLHTQRLAWNLSLHLLTMWQFGLLSAEQVVECRQQLDKPAFF